VQGLGTAFCSADCAYGCPGPPQAKTLKIPINPIPPTSTTRMFRNLNAKRHTVRARVASTSLLNHLPQVASHSVPLQVGTCDRGIRERPLQRAREVPMAGLLELHVPFGFVDP